jgi:SAM-dependent methyltransferase
VLDVGCGDGAFLLNARSCGWEAIGVDPDPKAVANASSKGLTVYESGIEYFDGKKEIFDAITLSHVIEHVHDPIAVLEFCFTLLKPGGQLWIETPNIDSLGHRHFRSNWRGLEVPRHLVLFNRNSLQHAVQLVGFSVPREISYRNAVPGLFRESFAIEGGCRSEGSGELSFRQRLQIVLAMSLGILNPGRREFLAVCSHKPGA